MIPTLPYRVLAIDPAITKSGWTVLDFLSFFPLKIKIVKTGQIDGQKLLKTRKEMMGNFQPQFCILDALSEVYESIIREYDPDQIVSEGTYGHLHLSALISLTLVINELRKLSKKIYERDIVSIPPTISKLSFTGSGGADKDVMRLAYQTNKYLEGTVPDDQISEHEIDACSHGVAHVRRDIIRDIIQISAKEKRAAKQARKEKALAKKKEKENKSVGVP